MQQPFELPPPDDETQALLDTISRTPALQPADAKYIRFYTRSKRSAEKSAAEGRPIFEAVEYVEILTPGDKDTVVDRPVRNLDKYVWAERYAAFRRGAAQDTGGTPLEKWEGVSQERVRELAFFRVTTVDQLAEVPDSNLRNLGANAREEREKARAYLAVMRGGAPVAELKAENEALKARLDALERLAAMQTQAAPQADVKPSKAK